jgi:hypothetical protein
VDLPTRSHRAIGGRPHRSHQIPRVVISIEPASGDETESYLIVRSSVASLGEAVDHFGPPWVCQVAGSEDVRISEVTSTHGKDRPGAASLNRTSLQALAGGIPCSHEFTYLTHLEGADDTVHLFAPAGNCNPLHVRRYQALASHPSLDESLFLLSFFFFSSPSPFSLFSYEADQHQTAVQFRSLLSCLQVLVYIYSTNLRYPAHRTCLTFFLDCRLTPFEHTHLLLRRHF